MVSSLKNMFLSLTVICIVAAAALAGVNKITSGAIESSKNAQRREAVASVFGSAVAYASLQEGVADGVSYTKALGSDDAFAGLAVEASSENGFGGHFSVMVGFDANGCVSGYSVLESSETPGLGQKASEWFQKDSEGCVIGKNPGENMFKVTKDGGQVDAISGSTITSRAFCECVNSAYQTFEKVCKK